MERHRGGPGNDRIFGGPGSTACTEALGARSTAAVGDSLFGQDRNDSLTGARQRDWLSGDDGFSQWLRRRPGQQGGDDLPFADRADIRMAGARMTGCR